jgi:hypothetical protein
MKGSMSGDACDFNNIATPAINNFLFLQIKSPKGNSRHSDIEEDSPTYASVKNCGPV